MMSENKSTKVVFISHRCLDHVIVHALQEKLQSSGFTVLVDPFQAGDRTCDKAQRAIKESTHFIFLATQNSVNREHELRNRQYVTESWQRARWVTIEYNCAEHCAMQQGLIVICVKVGNTAIPRILQQFIYIPFEIDTSLAQLSDRLLEPIASTNPLQRLSTDQERSKKLVEEGRISERNHATYNDERYLHSAITAYDRAILQDFCNHHAWLNKGWCLWKLRDDAIAWRYANMAQLLRPDSDRVKQVTERMSYGYRTLR
jgi:hypothetical protein